MTQYIVVLIRGERPDRIEAKRVIDERMAGNNARFVTVPKGWEDAELETCHKAYSRHPDLVKPYGGKGIVFDKLDGVQQKEPEGASVRVTRIVEEGPSGMTAPSGYRIEKRGPYYRLLHLDTGQEFPDKMLHKKPFEEFLASFEGE